MILSTSGSLPQRLRSPKVTSSVAVTVSRVLAISSVPLGLLLFVIPPGWISWWIPIHSALLAALIALSVFIHRPSNGQPWRWFCAAAVLTIPVVISLDRYRQTRRVGWGVVNVATMGVIVVAMGFAAVGSFRPFLRVPATARASRIGFGAIVIFAIVAIANLLDHRQSGVLGLLTSFLLGTAIAMAGVSTALFWTPLRRLGLTSSLLICSAAGLFELGQVIIEQVYDSTIPMKSLLAHPLIAMGLVAAAAFHPTMRQVGEPVLQLSERPLGFMPYFVYSAVLAAGGVMVAIDRQAWSDSRSRLFIDVIVAQLAIIAVLLTLLAARSTRKRGYRHARLRSELRGAIARNEIEAHFQPIVRVGDHAIAGYEALARWKHPRLGLLTASEFVPLASDEGYLSSIDHTMFLQAAAALPALCATADGDEPFVTVNIDPRRMQQLGFAASVLTLLKDAQLDPDGLMIEIVETSAIDDWRMFTENARLFHEAGIELAIDDFGAGFANFGVLVGLDPRMVKLDGSLVTAAIGSPRGQAVVRNAVRAARSAGAQVVAECVEDAECSNFLAELGFDFLQGFAFGKAASVAPPAVGASPKLGSVPKTEAAATLQAV